MPHPRYLRIPLLWSLKLSEIMWALSLLQHSLENTSRRIMGLILPISFFLGLKSYVAHYPISESIWLIHFLSFLYVHRKLQSLLFILTKTVFCICSFLITFYSLLILCLTYYLLKHFISDHSTFNFYSFQYLMPLGI